MESLKDLDKKWGEGIAELKALVEDGRAELEAKFSAAELRVARSNRFKSVEQAIEQAEAGIDMLLD